MYITKEEVSDICAKVYRLREEGTEDVEISTYLLGVFLFRDINWRKEDVDT